MQDANISGAPAPPVSNGCTTSKADKHDAWKACAAAGIAAGLAPGAPLSVTAIATPTNPVASLATVTPVEDDDWLFYGGRRFT
jgi:hypothetical protein